MKLAAALILPALIVLGIATFETRVLLNPGWSNKPTQGIVWDNQTFTTRAEFARWLRSRGTSYRVWARQHPSFTGVEPSREAQPRAKVEGARQKRADVLRSGELALYAVWGLVTIVIIIGDWTAQYVALRGLKHPDAFPASDLGIEPGDASAPASIMTAIAEKPPRTAGVKITDEGDGGTKIAEYLIENRLV